MEIVCSPSVTKALRVYLAAIFQLDISHADVRAQFVLPVALILERFSQPSVSFAVAVAVDVTDACAYFDQSIARGLLRNTDVAYTQAQIFIALDAFDGQVTDFLMNVEVGICRDFQFHVELGVARTGSTELQGCIVPGNVEVSPRLFHMALTPRPDCVLQTDLRGITAPDVEIANAEPHVNVSAGHKLTGVAMRFFILPVARGAERNKQQTKQQDLVSLPGLER